MEARIAASWACRTSNDYEKQFKNSIKHEVILFATKIVIAGIVLLGGAGYLFLKSAITDVYQNENQKVISDLRARYDLILADEQKRFEWKKNHDYAKNYVYLAEFYSKIEMPEDRKLEMLKKTFDRARTYFEYGLRSDPQQGSTYWELGELYYTYPKEYGFSSLVDLQLALNNYERAANHYGEIEISKGWRADALRMIGKIYFEQAKATMDKKNKSELLLKAVENLKKAEEDYISAIPESRNYNSPRLKETQKLINSAQHLQ